MKKLYFIPFFILAGIIFQFSSCDEKSYTVLIENKSSKPVSYVYNGEKDDLGITDGVDNSKQYIVAPYTQAPKDIDVIQNYGDEVFSETMTVRMEKYKENIYTFKDSDAIDLFVLNILPIEVVLRADKYIDDLNDSSEMIIPPNEIKIGKLYTATPNFTLYPSQYTVDWLFLQYAVNWFFLNEENPAIFVTISSNVE